MSSGLLMRMGVRLCCLGLEGRIVGREVVVVEC